MSLTVLHLEDSESDALLLREAFAASGCDVELKQFNRAAQALVELYAHGADLVVLDLLLAGDDRGLIVNELEVSPRLRRIPVVVLTGSQLPAQELVPQAMRYDSKPPAFEGWMDLARGYAQLALDRSGANGSRRVSRSVRGQGPRKGSGALHSRPH